MTYGVTFTCHVRDHGTILTYKPASDADARRLPPESGHVDHSLPIGRIHRGRVDLRRPPRLHRDEWRRKRSIRCNTRPVGNTSAPRA